MDPAATDGELDIRLAIKEPKTPLENAIFPPTAPRVSAAAPGHFNLGNSNNSPRGGRRRARRRQDGVTARRRRWSVDQLELDADQRTEGELGERAARDSQVAAEFDFGDGLDGQA